MNPPGAVQTVDDDLAEAVRTFFDVRPRLMAIGYRLLNSRTEAEDIVQETWVRWQNTDRTVVVDPPALLATMTRRLAINLIDSAHRRHEAGLALPDALPDVLAAAGVASSIDPVAAAETLDSVEQALRIVLERLNPRERAAFVLRDVFGYSYAQIADFLGAGAVNARQLVSRARRRLADDGRTAATVGDRRRFRDEFLVAARTGELAGFERVLAADLAA